MRRRSPFFDDDRIFSGDLAPDDAPPQLARIAGLIQAAKASPAATDEFAGEELIVSQMAAVVRETRRAEAAHDDRRHILGKVLSAKIIGAAAAVLLSGGVAAAATGALPTPVQEAVSHGLRHIGIPVPDPTAHLVPTNHPKTHTSSVSPTSTTTNAGSRTSSSTHPSISTNRFGLCTAYEHASVRKARSAALSRLTALALAKGESVNSYCAGAVPPSNSSAANLGSAHRPTATTSIGSSRPAKSKGHVPDGRGLHHPTTTPPAPPSSSHNGTTKKNTATDSVHKKTPKSTAVMSGHSASSSSTSTTSTIATTANATTSLPVKAKGHSPTNGNVGKGVPPVHTR